MARGKRGQRGGDAPARAVTLQKMVAVLNAVAGNTTPPPFSVADGVVTLAENAIPQQSLALYASVEAFTAYKLGELNQEPYLDSIIVQEMVAGTIRFQVSGKNHVTPDPASGASGASGASSSAPAPAAAAYGPSRRAQGPPTPQPPPPGTQQPGTQGPSGTPQQPGTQPPPQGLPKTTGPQPQPQPQPPLSGSTLQDQAMLRVAGTGGSGKKPSSAVKHRKKK